MSKYIKTNNFEVISFQINYKAKCGYQQKFYTGSNKPNL